MIALDTNVLIYCCDRRDARRQKLALDLVAGMTDGVLLWQVACEFIAARESSSSRASRPLTPGSGWRSSSAFFPRHADPCRARTRSRAPSRPPMGVLGCDAGQRLPRNGRRAPLLRGLAWAHQDRVSGDRQPLPLISKVDRSPRASGSEAADLAGCAVGVSLTVPRKQTKRPHVGGQAVHYACQSGPSKRVFSCRPVSGRVALTR